jgi:hypothetical protein
MVMRYAGKIINGQPTFLEAVKLPENANITIVIDLDVKSDEKFTSEQQAAIAFVEGIGKINAGGFDEETIKAFERWDNGEFRLNLGERVL